MGAAKTRRMLEVGRRAPEFQLDDLRGGTAKLSEMLLAGPVALAFFKITCPVCQMTLPYLERIHRDAAPGGMRLFGISQDDAESTADFNREFGITFPTLLDREEKDYPASNAYGISHVPSIFLVGQDGTISRALDGWNKNEIFDLAAKSGVNPFRPGEYVPEWKAG